MLRVGIGHDTHRLEPGYPLIIGGIPIEHDKGCVAHSDGDVLIHALIDALLGALAWGDIGEWFPDTDEQYKGVDSGQLLEQVVEKLDAEGWRPVNADCIVFTQRPKLSAFKQTIADNLSDHLRLGRGHVNVKAKTGEKVGPVGHEEAIEAQVVVLLERIP